MMTERDDLRSRAIPRLSCNRRMMRSKQQLSNTNRKHGESSPNHWITGQTLRYCGKPLRQSMRDHSPTLRTNPSSSTALQVSSPKQIANRFYKQFTTSKLGVHSSSREIQLVQIAVRWKSSKVAVTLTPDLVARAILAALKPWAQASSASST